VALRLLYCRVHKKRNGGNSVVAIRRQLPVYQAKTDMHFIGRALSEGKSDEKHQMLRTRRFIAFDILSELSEIGNKRRTNSPGTTAQPVRVTNLETMAHNLELTKKGRRRFAQRLPLNLGSYMPGGNAPPHKRGVGRDVSQCARVSWQQNSQGDR